MTSHKTVRSQSSGVGFLVAVICAAGGIAWRIRGGWPGPEATASQSESCLRRCSPSTGTEPRSRIASCATGAMRCPPRTPVCRRISCASCCRVCAPITCWRQASRAISKDCARALQRRSCRRRMSSRTCCTPRRWATRPTISCTRRSRPAAFSTHAMSAARSRAAAKHATIARFSPAALSPPGGAASNCGIPANPSAAALSIATIGGGGFLTAWPFGVAHPLASTMNPAPGMILADGALVPLCQPNCGNEFSIFTFGAQVIIDIVGYFRAPQGGYEI